jgi:aspartyl-tRNA(Asn)/glutamyl-tRNA(Gln) amidotransferase subunit A
MRAVDIAGRVVNGDVSAVEICENALSRASALDRLGAFLFVDADGARARAKSIDERRARGEKLGPLAGVPIALKDALVTHGIPTTAGSRVLEGWRPPYDGTAVARVLAADAILLGKTNMDEFAMGSSNENVAYKPCKNPHDESRTPGGSSGGSAVAVAASITPLALGSDTGGSIRQPAALTGVVGVKPTYGRVSRYGLVAFASSLDQIGPFATDVRSAARLLAAIAGHDPHDATSSSEPVPNWEAECDRGVRGLRLGIPDEYFGEGLDAEVRASVGAAIDVLEKEGCTVRPVKLPHTKHAVATYYVLATAEASSNLARFDGVRYGKRVPAKDLKSMYGATRDAGFGREVKRRILLGTFVLSAGYYDAYYLRAQKVRTLIRRDFEAAFAEVDAIVSPTTPTPAFRLGEKTSDPLAMYLSDVYTLPASLAGLPAASFPCGVSKAKLPIGVQAVTRAFDESTLFRIGAALDRAFAC